VKENGAVAMKNINVGDEELIELKEKAMVMRRDDQ